MKYFFSIALIFLIASCKTDSSLNGAAILERSITKHDPLNSWENALLNIHIQEPRVGNPYRYSIVQLSNAENSFRLQRNRDQHISTHMVDKHGNNTVLLNGKRESDALLISKYRLEPERNKTYQKFYQTMYGLPMSMNTLLEKITDVSTASFNNTDCYKIELILKEAVFSEHWNLFISKSDYTLKGVEIFFPERAGAGERIFFDGEISLDNMSIPRIRHWYELEDHSYSGSDIIVQDLTLTP